jgi:hypothetical protein
MRNISKIKYSVKRNFACLVTLRRRVAEKKEFLLSSLLTWYLAIVDIKRKNQAAGRMGLSEKRDKMNFSAKSIDKKKAITGVVLVCLSVFMMLFEGENTPFFMKAIRVVVLSAGLGFYVWGRFFSRGGD